MRIETKLEKNFSVKVRFFDAPTNIGALGIMFYAIIRAMKQHHNEAFMFAMNKFISEEIDEMMED
jgi:hypothetical protein